MLTSKEDVVDVLGLMSRDNLLVVNGSHVSFMKKYVGYSTFVDDKSIGRAKNKKFDKVVVFGEQFDASLAKKLAAMNRGTITYFLGCDLEHDYVEDFFDSNWLTNVWHLDSNIGICVTVDAVGQPLR